MNEAMYVLNGVALLDEKLPGWRELINWDILDISSLDRCIIGQLVAHSGTPFEYSSDLFEVLGIDGWFDGMEYGFDVGSINTMVYAPTTLAWKQWALSQGL